jgi:UDP-N-acetylglucosamine:LPS N-acetylglucosamine transferase
MAAGHDGVALELQRRLDELGYITQVCDYLKALPIRLGYLMRFLYSTQLRIAPFTYEAVYQLTTRFKFAYFAVYRFALLGCRRLSLWAGGYDLIVTTYPLAGQALGHMRRRGLPAKVVIVLTDFSVHPLWVSRYADLHLTVAQDPAERVISIEPGACVAVAGAIVRPAFLDVYTKESLHGQRVLARTELGVRQPTTLLVAGSWGVGELKAVAKELITHGLPTPVIVCGSNRRLYKKLKRKKLGIVCGWVDDMVSIMTTSDVLVHNAGGLMAIEGLAVGLTVIGYRCIPGHGCANSEAMARAGVAMHACSEGSIVNVLRQLDASRLTRLNSHARELFAVDAAEVIANVVRD